MSQINETAIKTPGVYTTEIPLFPPSVAQVATAIPAFIGFTEKATRSGKNVINKAVRISSLVQYVQYFGGAVNSLTATVALSAENAVESVDIGPKYQLFNAIQLFFNHGGSNCYVISVGLYKDTAPAITDFIEAGEVRCLDVLKKEDEPTLIVIPDAVMLEEPDFNSLMSAALLQCSELQDRFTILDVRDGFLERSFDENDVISHFRNGIAGSNYGAAYYPWLRTSLPYNISYGNTQLQKPKGTDVDTNTVITGNSFITQLDKIAIDKSNLFDAFLEDKSELMGSLMSRADLENRLGEISNMLTTFIGWGDDITDTTPAVPGGLTVKKKFDEYVKAGADNKFTPIEKLIRELVVLDDNYPGGELGRAAAFAGYQAAVPADATIYAGIAAGDDVGAVQKVGFRVKTLFSNTFNYLQSFNNEVQNLMDGIELNLISTNALYRNIKTAIKLEGIIVPPSGAIAGVYAAVDGTKGVWKAPANVPLNTVIEPMVTIDNNIQDDLNVDVNSGKSINAIRTFTGKGTLVWGARTLAGNDNEWRYVSVRRLFIMVEESAKKATEPFVFEPNDANTWAKVRGMLENYLTVLWRQGALAGAKAEHAFFVKCGLGQTMTSDDILNGKLIVEIGMAAVRPAEFIILRFMHKRQES